MPSTTDSKRPDFCSKLCSLQNRMQSTRISKGRWDSGKAGDGERSIKPSYTGMCSSKIATRIKCLKAGKELELSNAVKYFSRSPAQ